MTFDELFKDHNLTPEERASLVNYLAHIRAEATRKALTIGAPCAKCGRPNSEHGYGKCPVVGPFALTPGMQQALGRALRRSVVVVAEGEKLVEAGKFIHDGERWATVDPAYADDPDVVTLYRRA